MTSIQTLKEQEKILLEKINLLEQDIELMQLRLSVCQKNCKVRERQLSMETTRYYKVMQYLEKNFPDVHKSISENMIQPLEEDSASILPVEEDTRSLVKHKLRQEAYSKFKED